MTLLGKWALLAGLLLAAAGGGSYFWCLGLGDGPLVGTTLGGYWPNESMHFGDWLEGERQRRSAAPVRISGEGTSRDVTLRQLGIEVDVARILETVRRQKQHGPLVARLWRGVGARLGANDLVWLTRFDRDTARATLAVIAADVDRPAVDAELDLAHRRQVKAMSGMRLDVEATLDYLESHASVDLESVPLVQNEVPPRIRDADLLGMDIAHVTSRFETDFRTRAGTRAINIRVAARALHGQVLSPGAVFSFNQTVGPRVEARGYREAPVIVDDELEPGVGGGVCQVATTLHGAAVLAGLEVLERRSHSRPSGYAPLGMDATVIDGTVDLKLRNPYPTPLAIMASFPDPYRLRIELVGFDPGIRFEHTYAVTKRREFYRRVSTRSDLAAGVIQKKQKGNWGYDVTSTVTARPSDGTPSQRRYASRYWPVPEVYWIGPETDLAALPALPDGATGVQLDGKTIQGTIPSEIEARAAQPDETPDSTEQ